MSEEKLNNITYRMESGDNRSFTEVIGQHVMEHIQKFKHEAFDSGKKEHQGIKFLGTISGIKASVYMSYEEPDVDLDKLPKLIRKHHLGTEIVKEFEVDND